MKYIITLLLAFPLILVSCKKNAADDNGCIARKSVSPKDHTINSGDIATVDKLFLSNGIDNSNFRYFRYKHDTMQIYYAPFTRYDHKLVRVDQFANGLHVFGADMVFNFKNDSISSSGNNSFDVSSLDKTPHLMLSQVRKLFSDDIKQNYTSSANDSDPCFDAEFGYYKKTTAIGSNENKTVKAWKVTMKNKEYPVGYYEDEDGKRIYFDNGIRTFY
jgi:hypothetical protein